MTVLLAATGLHKSYGEETILRGIDFQVDRGQSVAITGPSGCGKSTLLSLLGLLLPPTAGNLYVEGKDASALSDGEQAALRNQAFGFLFQSCQLLGSLTVLDNVLVPGYLARRRGLEDRAKRLLGELGLSDRLAHYPHQLSLGQKRRVSIARALLLAPPIILADEPTNDLDEERAQQVADYLLTLPQQGYALVVVSHDAALLRRADCCWQLQDGQLQPWQ